ncbi:IPT/TIG domain-containing protein [Terrimonas pollutisoli]|uniref:IPT/TIG domain-containing protein n=1 Tax=Terrimonas pollutisoli TaxID=3034147 RepID=UPI0023ECC292|nr:IPT/TIG domain-containing protein [Terrimonas sp. H1YJ31]
MRSGIFALLLFSIALLQACQKEIDESILDEIPVSDSLVIRYFTPDTAKEGTNVTIVGSGFDTAFLNNSVKVNGTALSIVNVTDTSLVVTIPEGATTGKISITVDGKTIFTEKDLVIQGDIVADSLAIHYFTPDTASTGMNVTIAGSGFDTAIANNLVKLNTTSLTVVSVTDTSIVVLIPDGAATGKISVTVNGETAITEKDLVILQPGIKMWVQKADFKGPEPEEGPGYYSSFSLNGKGYYLYYDKLWMYSPETNEWTEKQSMPASQVFQYGFCFTIGDKAYFGLGALAPGDDISSSKQVWEYNATTNAWTQKKDFPGSQRIVPFSFAIGNTGYIGGGDPTNWGGEQIFDFWKYDQATDTWAQLKNFPGSRAISLSGVAVENNGFVVELGQNNPTAPLTEYKDIFIWKYYPSNDSWEKKAMLPTPGVQYGGGGTTFVIDKKIYLGVGIYDLDAVDGQRKNFWMYDPTANTWINKTDIGGGFRVFGQGFTINDKGYIGLGTGETTVDVKKDFWEYTP